MQRLVLVVGMVENWMDSTLRLQRAGVATTQDPCCHLFNFGSCWNPAVASNPEMMEDLFNSIDNINLLNVHHKKKWRAETITRGDKYENEINLKIKVTNISALRPLQTSNPSETRFLTHAVPCCGCWDGRVMDGFNVVAPASWDSRSCLRENLE